MGARTGRELTMNWSKSWKRMGQVLAFDTRLKVAVFAVTLVDLKTSLKIINVQVQESTTTKRDIMHVRSGEPN